MNSPVPDTRHSLIQRLSDKCDRAAWDQFVAIYEPLVYRLARAKGFQDADARDVAQEVLLAVSRAVDRWEPDGQRGRFRDWLFRIARNLMINFLTRRMHRPIGSGDSGINKLLNCQCDPNSSESSCFDLEYRREVFCQAAEHVRRKVKPATWQAFWRTSVESQPIATVAADLGISTGAVHIARSRVLGRLREFVRQFEQQGETDG
ncbi:MAG: sigma-70 family RNA polymerase sigma factor [Planctomycetales bacterium]|nr:sigma-70 family RNA polymerase sigma factor [Planctomycetales bacterium]